MGSTDKSDERALFVAYVTGGLSMADREEMEDRLLADQEFSDSMAAYEQEIIDAYAAGSYTSAETANLRQWVEGSSARMRRVAMARAFLDRNKRRARRFLGMVAVLALAACLLLAIGLGVKWHSRIKNQNPPPQEAMQSSPPAASTPVKPVAKSPDVILLVAERIRGDEGQVPTFSLHAGSPLKLEVLLATDPGFGYTLTITRDGNGREPVFERSNLEPQSINGQRYLSVPLTGESFVPGTYHLTLTRKGETHVLRFHLNWKAAQ